MVKNPPASAGDPGSIPGLERSSGERNGNTLDSCMENSMDRGAWRAMVCGISETEQLRVELSQGVCVCVCVCVCVYTSKI